MTTRTTSLAKSHIVVSTKTNDPIDNVRISTVVRRSDGTFRRSTIRARKHAAVYPIRMRPGIYPFIVHAPSFLSAHGCVEFEKGVLHTHEFKLELKKTPVFAPLEKLDRNVQEVFERSAEKSGADTASKYYEGLGPVRKAAALNILAKMARTPVIERRSVIDYVDHIYKYSPDRVYARLVNGRSLFADIRKTRERRTKSIFSPASSALHKGFEAASFKTREEDRMGNLQLSLSSLGSKSVNVDADIDIYSGLLLHLFGEVFRNHLTGLMTSPFKVFKVLIKEKCDPGYRLK